MVYGRNIATSVIPGYHWLSEEEVSPWKLWFTKTTMQANCWSIYTFNTDRTAALDIQKNWTNEITGVVHSPFVDSQDLFAMQAEGINFNNTFNLQYWVYFI